MNDKLGNRGIEEVGNADRSINNLISLVSMWAHERNLVDGSNSQQQLGKLVEELGELATGINKKNPTLFKDGLGDMLVVMIILARMNDTTLRECLDLSYNEIKDRKGRMVDGIFIKENDKDVAV